MFGKNAATSHHESRALSVVGRDCPSRWGEEANKHHEPVIQAERIGPDHTRAVDQVPRVKRDDDRPRAAQWVCASKSATTLTVSEGWRPYP